VDSVDDADDVDWSCCRLVVVDVTLVVDVEVANHDVVLVDVVLIIVGVAAVVKDAKKCMIFSSLLLLLTELQLWKRHFADVRGCIPGRRFAP
jgi:hypothetical protein